MDRGGDPGARPRGGAKVKLRIGVWALGLYLFLGFAVLWPLAAVIRRGLGPGLARALADPYYWGRFLWSLEYGLLASLLVIALALPLAYALRYRFPGRALLVALLGVPFVMPTIVVAAGFLALVGPRGLLGVDLSGTVFVLVWASVFYNLGMAARILHGLLARTGEGLEAAARTLGATPFRAFRRVTLPLLWPGILAAGGLTFVYTFASFGVPLLLGGYRYATLEVEVYRLLAYQLDFAGASALVLWQAAVLALVSAGYLWAGGRIAGGLQPGEPRALAPGAARWLSALLWMGFFLVTAPLWALLLESLRGPEGFGLGNYLRLLSGGDGVPLGQALANTLRFSLGALLLAAPVGLAYALAAARGSRLADLAGLVPLFVSPVSLGVGYLLAYPRLRASALVLVLAYATLAYPLFARSVVPALRGLAPELLEAAATLGAGPFRRLLRVELPLVRPALLSGAALALASAIGEFGATMLLVRPEWTTLTIAIYQRLGRPGIANYGEAMAMSVLLAALSGLLFAAFAKGAELG